MAAHIDLDAILEGEQGLPYTFTYGGQEYELAPQIDMRAIILMQGEEIHEAMRVLLGEEQWDRFKRARTRLTPERFQALMQGYAKHQGVGDMGESSASSSSSVGTGTPSRLTLPGITGSTSGQSSQQAS